MKQLLPDLQTHLPRLAVLTDHLIPDGQLVKSCDSSCWSVAFSPDSTHVAWSSGYSIVHIIPWDKENGRRSSLSALVLDAGAPVHSLDFTTSSSITNTTSSITNTTNSITNTTRSRRYRYKKWGDLLLATGLRNGQIKIWDAATGRLIFRLIDHRSCVQDLQFAPDHSLRLASASHDGSIKFWDLTDDGNMYQSIRLMKTTVVLALSWAPDGRRLATASSGRNAVIWRCIRDDDASYCDDDDDDDGIRSMKMTQSTKLLGGHCNEIIDIRFSPDGVTVATASYDTRVILWDSYLGRMIRQYNHIIPFPSLIFASGQNECWIRSVAFNSYGNMLASVADDGLIRFWHIDNESSPCQTSPCGDALYVTFSPGSGTAAIGGRSGDVQVYTMTPTPLLLPSLQHLCRVIIRCRVGHTDNTTRLDLPNKIMRYLRYEM